MMTAYIDSVKEAIKGSVRLAQKELGNTTTESQDEDTSSDPVIAFYNAHKQILRASGKQRRLDVLRTKAHLRPMLINGEQEAAIKKLDTVAATLREQAADAQRLQTKETVKAWLQYLIGNREGDLIPPSPGMSTEPWGKKFSPIDGLLDIGFQIIDQDPVKPVRVKTAIIHGVSYPVAERIWRMRILEELVGITIRAYGMPSTNFFEIPIWVIRYPDGRLQFADWATPQHVKNTGYKSYLMNKGGHTHDRYGYPVRAGEEAGARKLMLKEILAKSLNEHGVPVMTDSEQ
jgi:hypothetical protein